MLTPRPDDQPPDEFTSPLQEALTNAAYWNERVRALKRQSAVMDALAEAPHELRNSVREHLQERVEPPQPPVRPGDPIGGGGFKAEQGGR
jgi:hypothetical protein